MFFLKKSTTSAFTSIPSSVPRSAASASARLALSCSHLKSRRSKGAKKTCWDYWHIQVSWRGWLLPPQTSVRPLIRFIPVHTFLTSFVWKLCSWSTLFLYPSLAFFVSTVRTFWASRNWQVSNCGVFSHHGRVILSCLYIVPCTL